MGAGGGGTLPTPDLLRSNTGIRGFYSPYARKPPLNMRELAQREFHLNELCGLIIGRMGYFSTRGVIFFQGINFAGGWGVGVGVNFIKVMSSLS